MSNTGLALMRSVARALAGQDGAHRPCYRTSVSGADVGPLRTAQVHVDGLSGHPVAVVWVSDDGTEGVDFCLHGWCTHLAVGRIASLLAPMGMLVWLRADNDSIAVVSGGRDMMAARSMTVVGDRETWRAARLPGGKVVLYKVRGLLWKVQETGKNEKNEKEEKQ